MFKSNLFKDKFVNKEDPERKFSLITRTSLDSKLPYEVIVVHPDYNDGEETLIGQFRDIPTATHVHNYWITMLPEIESLVLNKGESVFDVQKRGT